MSDIGILRQLSGPYAQCRNARQGWSQRRNPKDPGNPPNQYYEERRDHQAHTKKPNALQPDSTRKKEAKSHSYQPDRQFMGSTDL